MSQGLARDFFTTASGLAVRGGASLYAQMLGAIGAGASLYDPSDLTSLYQSRTGGSAGAVDSVVGIMLDKAQMGNTTAAAFIAGQSNIWSNAAASFAGESSQVSSGVYRIYSSAGSNSYVANTGLLTVGALYEVKFTIDSITTLGSGVRVQDTGEIFTTTGQKTTILKADNAALFIKRNSVTGTTDIQISNVQVRAIPGSHALAPSDAARPILRSASGLYYLDADGTDDWMQIFPTLNLGEQWWHVGGWQSDTASRYLFATSNDASGRSALVHSGVGGKMRWFNSGGSTADLSATSLTGVSRVLTVEQTSTTVLAGRVDGGASAGSITPYDDSAATQGLALFNSRNSTYNNGWDGRFYGGIWTPGALSPSLRSLCERWAASKCGVVL